MTFYAKRFSTFMYKTTALLLVLVVALEYDAQSDTNFPYSPVFRGSTIEKITWSTNSNFLYFYTSQPNATYGFDVTTMTLTETGIHLHSPDNLLTNPQDLSIPEISFAANSILYPSPSGRFVVFAQAETVKDFYPIAILDTGTGNILEIDEVFVLFYPSNFSYFSVEWSEGEDSFLFTTLGIGGNSITHLIYNVLSTQPKSIDLSNEVNIAGTLDNVRAFDVAKDGNTLLLKRFRFNEKTGESIPELFTWNILTNEVNTIAVGDSFSIANFVENEVNKIIYISMEGTFEYDADQQYIEKINSTVTSRLIGLVNALSYDGTYLATARIGFPDELYVLKLR
jgi:hypothetical protein